MVTSLVMLVSWAKCVVNRNKAKWQSQISRYSLQLRCSNKYAFCTSVFMMGPGVSRHPFFWEVWTLWEM